MKTLPTKLEAQRKKQSAEILYAFEIGFDTGSKIITGDVRVIDGATTIPALLKNSAITDKGGSLDVHESALNVSASTRYKNRPIAAWEIPENATSLSDGRLVFDGVISKEPDNRDGILLVKMGEKIRRIVTIPSNSDVIDTGAYPNASEGVAGKYKPTIYGTVQKAEMLGVDVPISTTLSADVTPFNEELKTADATGFAASGQVVVDGVIYTYSARDDRTFYGVQITEYHYSGTTVAETGSAVYLGASHAVSAIEEIRGDDQILDTATISLSEAAATFSSLPTVERVSQRRNVRVNFDEVDASNTATNAINAIVAATATDSNIATTTSLPLVFSTGALELSRNETLVFPAQTQDKIITGSYTVIFSIDATGYTGNAEVKVGSATVWAMRNGSVVYNNSPATITYDEQTNSLPVSVARNTAGPAVEVTVTAATRTIVLGNTDATAFADIANGEQLVVNQTTVNPDRGKITRAQVAIEWFPTDEYTASEDTEVWFDGVKIGELSLDQPAGTSINQNIEIDVDSSGSTGFKNSDLSTTVSGGTASLNNVQNVVQMAYGISYALSSSGGFVYVGKASFRPPKGAIPGSHSARVRSHNATTTFQAVARINDSSTRTFSLVPGGVQNTGMFILSDTTDCEFVHTIINGLFGPNDYLNEPKGYTIEVDWIINPVSQNNTPASGSTNVLNPTLPTTVSGTGSDTVVITVPAAPRTIINTIALPQITEWSDLTGKQLKLVYTGGEGVNVEIVRAVIAVDYDAIANVKADKISATITGKSGNPTEVMKDLIEAMGDKVDTHEFVKSKNWYSANSWAFARRINTPIDALTLLSRAADQGLAVIFNIDGRKAIVRQLDTSRDQIQVYKSDLTRPLQFGWTQKSITALRLNHSFVGNGYTKVSTADNATNKWLSRGYRDNGQTEESVEINAIWIGDDTTAANYLDGFSRLNGPARRLARISLPFTNMHNQQGDIADLDDLASRFMVMEATTSNHWIDFTLAEIPE